MLPAAHNAPQSRRWVKALRQTWIHCYKHTLRGADAVEPAIADTSRLMAANQTLTKAVQDLEGKAAGADSEYWKVWMCGCSPRPCMNWRGRPQEQTQSTGRCATCVDVCGCDMCGCNMCGCVCVDAWNDVTTGSTGSAYTFGCVEDREGMWMCGRHDVATGCARLCKRCFGHGTM